MINNTRKGFTLIEILIVVAIIAILASVVLVGLGPTQSLGRDARRVSDLHEVQNGLELYYNANGQYYVPAAGGTWADNVQTILTGANIGINSVPDDPSGGAVHYAYGTDTGGTQYILEADLENNSGGSWNGYTPPSNIGLMSSWTALSHGASSLQCDGNNAPAPGPYQYCITL